MYVFVYGYGRATCYPLDFDTRRHKASLMRTNMWVCASAYMRGVCCECERDFDIVCMQCVSIEVWNEKQLIMVMESGAFYLILYITFQWICQLYFLLITTKMNYNA